MSKSNNHIQALTGLRFFAAAMVVLLHFTQPAKGILGNFISHGFVGVTIFFILSGFILSFSYIRKPGEMKGSKQAFWGARVARLYPVYLVGIILFAPIIAMGDEPVYTRVIAAFLSLSLTQSWLHPLGLHWGMWNPPGWSLSVEAIFYLIFPFICIPLSKLPQKKLAWFALACWLLSVIPTVVYVLTGSINGLFWMFTPLPRLPEFLLGIALGLIWKNRTTAMFDNVAPFISVASSAALVAIMCLPLSNEFFFNGATAPLAGLLICALACGRGVLARTLSLRGVTMLGSASYSLYILHWPIWRILKYFFGKSDLYLLMPNIYFFIYFVFTVACSYMCFKFFEEPINLILRKRLMQAPGRGPSLSILSAQ
jgi:peptidoglycan/LPS O-acetylase OafA/YrhL